MTIDDIPCIIVLVLKYKRVFVEILGRQVSLSNFHSHEGILSHFLEKVMAYYKTKSGEVLYVKDFRPTTEVFIKCLGSFPNDVVNNPIIVEDELTQDQFLQLNKVSEATASKLHPSLVNYVKIYDTAGSGLQS